MLDSKLSSSLPTIGRRGLLGGALLGLTGLGLSACGGSSPSSAGAADSAAQPAVASPTAAPAATTDSVKAAFRQLEKQYDARLGVYALDTGSGTGVYHRADERFAMCSTFKVLAVGAVLQSIGTEGLGAQIRYTAADLVDYSPITEGQNSMSLGELCAAALQYSDNTAGNLILRDVGGPAAVTDLARQFGDDTTRLDRIEPDLNEATPGDERDTTTPEMIGNAFYTLLEGETLTEVARRQLKTWMLGNTTGDQRIRAAVPRGWKVADKTGSGSYGTANDVAMLYPKGKRPPIVLAVMSSKDQPDADYDENLLKDATAAALNALGV